MEKRYAGKVGGLAGLDEAKQGLARIKKEILEGGEVAGPSLDQLREKIDPVINARTPIDTGKLVTNNKSKLVNNYSVVFYNETDYAGHVHDGTSKMPARPFMEQAIDEGKDGLPNIYEKNAGDFIKKVERENKPS